VVIPEYPKISPTLEKLLKRILVKDYLNRIDWKELFEYTVTEAGEIFGPGVNPNSAQFGLRASIRNTSNFGSNGLNFSTNNGSSAQYGGQLNPNNNSVNNDSLKGTSPLLSPKPGKESTAEDNRNYLMKKKSPVKMDEVPTGANTPVNGNSGINTSINYTNNLIKNEQYAKNDRNNRVELLLKNHAKCSTLNQMILDIFRFEHPRSLYIAYYLFKNIEKEIASLSDSLKKETNSPDTANNQDILKEFKVAVEKELEGVKSSLFLLR